MITPEIRHAIKCLQEEKALTSDGLAKLVVVSQSSANSWRNGQAKSIRPAHWAKLKPYLDPYLPKDTPTPTQRPNPKVESNAEFVTEPMPTYPVISLAAAAECNTAIIPMADYADANSEERVSVHNGRPGDVAIRVVGDSMEPWYPAGTIVLVRPGARLRNGDGVIAILADGSVVFKTYVERKDTFLLLSINEDNGCKLEFKKSDHFAVRGIYLVVTSIRDEIKLRETMHASGKHHFWERYLDDHT